MNDKLVSFDDSQQEAEANPEVEFIPTNGGHCNVYEEGVRKLIVNALTQEK